jgi:hypothetical protein
MRGTQRCYPVLTGRPTDDAATHHVHMAMQNDGSRRPCTKNRECRGRKPSRGRMHRRRMLARAGRRRDEERIGVSREAE